MATMDVDQLAAFVAVVRAGSFTAAAKKLGTQKAHVSRTISRLEKQMGVRLLQRSTRSLAVTEIGRELYERATSILAAIEDTAATIQKAQDEPQGVLKLTCGAEFGVLVVNGWIVEYLQTYPRVQVDVESTNRVVDLIHDSTLSRLASFSDLKQIPVRILKPRGVAPRELEQLRRVKLHATRFKRFECCPAIVHLDGVDRGTELGLGWRAWPQNQFEILSWHADGQEPRSVRRWSVDPLLETDDVCVEFERLVLVPDQQRNVRYFFQHIVSPCETVSCLMTSQDERL